MTKPPETPAPSADATTAQTPASAAWSNQRERSNLTMLRVMRWIATTLGRKAARCVLPPITLYYLAKGGSTTDASRQYLTRILGRAPTWRERYRHVHHFAATILDRVYLLQERFDLFDIQLTGLDHFDRMLEDGRGALLLGAHMGSFEAMRALGQSHKGVKVAVAMYEDNARMINATLQAIAPEAELHTIALGQLDAMIELQHWLDDGGVAGLLADRTLHNNAAVTGFGASCGAPRSTGLLTLPFLGRPAVFSDGPFRLAAMLRRPVVFMVGLYHGGNRYELRCLPLADFRHVGRGAARDAALAEAVTRYVALLEALCRETPYNWFNFFDFWADACTDTPGS